MKPLPLIVGFGGINSAGRSSFHHAYNRIIYDSLSRREKERTIGSLAVLMRLGKFKKGRFFNNSCESLSENEIKALEQKVLNGTLIRTLNANHFNPTKIKKSLKLSSKGKIFSLKSKTLPSRIPDSWKIIDQNSDETTIEALNELDLKTDVNYSLSVQAASSLPDGFEPSTLYKSNFHPRGLQLAIIGASDSIKSIGIDWDEIKQLVPPDQIAVYSASAMAQLDSNGIAGMLQARLKGKRVSSKQLPLGLNTMPADFINAYVLGNIGVTGANAGACATFLYNLRLAVDDIQQGKRKIVIVGNAEAPLEPEIIEGYAAMSALATDLNLVKMDGTTDPNHRKASRPFGENCGFVLGESSQYLVLMDDSLAIEIGANIHGSVMEVFTSADGFKRSISAPGPGNYITLAKAVANAIANFGAENVRSSSFVQAHGSSTPQNRTTESKILSEIASSFGINDWPITAVKAFVGHSLAPASADQLINTLGILQHKVIPGIKTISSIASDVEQKNLSFILNDTNLGDSAKIGFLNSKGFGGNNATGTVVSPSLTMMMLLRRYGQQRINKYKKMNESVDQNAENYDTYCLENGLTPIYKFGDQMIDEEKLELKSDKLYVPGYDVPIELKFESTYKDMFNDK
ncbi:MAG: beta-ketoacyl synthase [Pseudomonadota bacterium]|nr:beta-ketoacyl synthase [Pseudomonadota bacterium]